MTSTSVVVFVVVYPSVCRLDRRASVVRNDVDGKKNLNGSTLSQTGAQCDQYGTKRLLE